MALKITDARYITSAPSIKEAPEWQYPEIAMVGRSNVGKSSLINALTNRKQLAKTSNTPGKTRLMNFYEINQAFALVDLPGYGYAKVSKTMQAQWQKQFEHYLQRRQNLVLVLQLIDSRHGPQANDEAMLSWLEKRDIPVVLVLTKGDKLSKTALTQSQHQAAKQLKLEADQIIPFSAETGWGKDSLLRFLADYLEAIQSRVLS